MNDRPRSREDRLDPGGEMRRRAEGLAALARPPWREYLRALGVSPADLARARALLDEHEARFGGLDSDADVLTTHGWLLFELSPHDAYRDAAALIREGHVDDAEQRIVNAWNYHDCALLRLATHRVDGLYVDFDADYDTDPGGLLIGQARAGIIEQAIECHRDGRYAAAINLALAQIDGIVADFSDTGHAFFTRKPNTDQPRANLADEATLAGHPGALVALATLMTERCDSTETTGRMMRHGIMHGRELGYGTRRNSTQALATLLAVIVWAQPIARARIDAANSERQAAHAGADDRDEHGRRLWRAGFVEAKRGLQALADYQASFHRQHGRYAASVDEIDPDRLLREDFPNAATAAAPDRQTYWAWAHTGSEYVFGLAGTAGEAIRWSYAGVKVPVAGPDSDVDWRHAVEDPAHPDW